MNVAYFVVQQTMYFAIPLLIVAIGAMYSERSGVINIALEGIMVMGAFAGIFFINIFQGTLSGQGLFLLAMLVAGLTGGLFSLLHAFASINMKADQTISGTALNLFAPAYIGILIFAVAAFVIKNTRFGLRLRACGEHPGAADSVGVNVYKIRYAGVIISGVLGGIGGLIFVVPTSTNFNASVAGYGFLAIAVLIFGQWRSNKILMAAFFFGIMKTLSSAYSTIPFLKTLPIPNEVYKMIPYIATLVVLAFFSKNSQAPKAEGIPYDKGSR